MSAPRQWEGLDPRQKVMVVTNEIVELLRELEHLTAPDGEVDLALEEASQSFDTLFNSGHFIIDTGENNLSIDSQLLDRAEELIVQEKSKLSESNISFEGKDKHADFFLSLSGSIKDRDKSKESLDVSHQSISGGSDLSEDWDRMTSQSNTSPQVSDFEEMPEHDENKKLGSVNVNEKTVNSRKTFGTSVYESMSHYSTPTSKNKSDSKTKRSHRTSTVF